jgi:hypothetical protein
MAAIAKGTATANTTAFLPDTQPSRIARIERKLITGRFIKTAVTTPGVYERNSKDAGMWGMKTFASIGDFIPEQQVRPDTFFALPLTEIRHHEGGDG